MRDRRNEVRLGAPGHPLARHATQDEVPAGGQHAPRERHGEEQQPAPRRCRRRGRGTREVQHPLVATGVAEHASRGSGYDARVAQEGCAASVAHGPGQFGDGGADEARQVAPVGNDGPDAVACRRPGHDGRAGRQAYRAVARLTRGALVGPRPLDRLGHCQVSGRRNQWCPSPGRGLLRVVLELCPHQGPVSGQQVASETRGLVSEALVVLPCLEHAGATDTCDKSRRQSIHTRRLHGLQLVVGRKRRVEPAHLALDARHSRDGGRRRCGVPTRRGDPVVRRQGACQVAPELEHLGSIEGRRLAHAGRGHSRVWDEQHTRTRRQLDAAWPQVEVEQGAARPLRPLRSLRGERGKIGDGNADGGRRGLGRLLEPIGLALALERRVLLHQEPRQPRQHGRRHRGQYDDGQLQLALRVEPLPTRHVQSSVPRSCQPRVVELSGGCQGAGRDAGRASPRCALAP